MLNRVVEKHPTAMFALLLSVMVLLVSSLSIQSVMTSFLAGHEFRPLQAGLAEIMLGLLTILCAIMFFAPLEGRWNKKQLIFLVIAAFAVWRLSVINHLLNVAMGITS